MGKMFDDLKQGLHQIAEYENGMRDGYVAHVPTQVDVRHIRQKLHMTQRTFSGMFGFSLDAVRHWETGRRQPESAARVLLTVIDKNPKAVLEALAEQQ